MLTRLRSSIFNQFTKGGTNKLSSIFSTQKNHFSSERDYSDEEWDEGEESSAGGEFIGIAVVGLTGYGLYSHFGKKTNGVADKPELIPTNSPSLTNK